MVQQAGRNWWVIAVLSVFLAACVTMSGTRPGRKDRGIKLGHQRHAQEKMACTDCHATDKGEPAMPDHDVCTACHDFKVDKPVEKECGLCHVRPEYAVTARVKALSAEVKFAHAPHLKKELACALCHSDPDKAVLPRGSVMSFCTDCHAKTDAKLNECSVCHSEIDKNVRPKYHGKQRLPHDAPLIWETQHGQESKKDPRFCALCHDKEASCEDCHRKTPPRSHTVSWRRTGHGERANWDRDKCAACHEEDSCLKCHQHTEPSSHRRGWGFPMNRHCLTCHYPAQNTGCTVCHESIEHRGALPSPHLVGVYGGSCRLCHPGGNPYRAPHVLNGTVKCLACHG